MLSFTVVLFALVYARHAFSQVTTLYIPGFDPQAVTANLLGSQDGLTSYVIAPGVASADFDSPGFDGPATLVVGANTAAVTYIDETLGIALFENCQVADGQAVCEDVVVQMGSDGFTETDTQTETVVPITVQGGGSVSIQTSPVPTGNFATWTTPAVWTSAYSTFPGESIPTPTGSASNSRSRSSGSSSATDSTPTGNNSGALELHASGLLAAVIAGLVGIYAVA